MDYHILKKYRYTNRDQFESLYSSRYENELAFHYDFEIHGFPCFSLPTTEILNLTSRIYKLTQTLIYLKSKLPQIALEQYTQTCLIDEVKLTNEIEGVNSTRREIQDILNTQSITKKNMRLYGLVQKYNLLNNSEKISIQNYSDIRNIYNELVSEEIKNNDPLKLPDGHFFRKESVSVYSPHMKEIHRGISGEAEIIDCMEKALFILHDKSLPPLIRISVFHYLFGYIHPFYDGNGRTNRFISSYLLSKELDPLISYHLATTIKQNVSKYYKSFDYTNDIDNRGDLTGFITSFLEIILASIEALIDSLEDKIERLHYFEQILLSNFKDKTDYRILHLLLQNSLFGLEPLSAREMAEMLDKSYVTINNRLKKDSIKTLLRSDIPHKYDLDLDIVTCSHHLNP
nr:Fic family protein [uncultured Anaerostipes sp.]